MSDGANSWLCRKKWILTGIGVPLLVIGWWAFRPEKLWVNVKVNEPAPFGSSADLQPLYTGLLAGRAHPTSGRASIYRAPGGKRDLRLTDFMTSNGPDVHVVLAESTDESLTQNFVNGELNSVELGRLKANQGDQNYDLPDSADLSKYGSNLWFSRMRARVRSSRVDHSPMYTATDLVVDVILEAARATVGDASMPGRTASD